METRTALVTGSTSGIGRPPHSNSPAMASASWSPAAMPSEAGGSGANPCRRRRGVVRRPPIYAMRSPQQNSRPRPPIRRVRRRIPGHPGEQRRDRCRRTDRRHEESTFDTVLSTNLKAPFYLVANLAPAMAARGGGAIVNVSTLAAERALPGLGVYGASKAALDLLTKSWAAEFGPAGVRVNSVSPGPTRTPGAEVWERPAATGGAGPAGFRRRSRRHRRSDRVPGQR